MSEAVLLPDPVMQRIEGLKNNKDESPADVIVRLLDYYNEESDIDLKRWEDRAKEAWDEYKRGETISESDMMKKYGIQ
jgi:hypothetical protein